MGEADGKKKRGFFVFFLYSARFLRLKKKNVCGCLWVWVCPWLRFNQWQGVLQVRVLVTYICVCERVSVCIFMYEWICV